VPSLSVPCGYVTPQGSDKPLPLGLELTAPLFAERLLIGVARAYESGTQHAAHRVPPVLEASAR
jgi:Asp-tRNA(Asn)/Glu-tRNA(Gln) amidotransferase A subunit family amidase